MFTCLLSVRRERCQRDCPRRRERYSSTATICYHKQDLAEGKIIIFWYFYSYYFGLWSWSANKLLPYLSNWGESRGRVVKADSSPLVGSNPSTVYWMDISDASYYINKNNKNKGSRMGLTTKKIIKNSSLSLVGFQHMQQCHQVSWNIPLSLFAPHFDPNKWCGKNCLLSKRLNFEPKTS